MGKVTITRVDNGYIVEVTKVNFTSGRPETTVSIHAEFDDVLEVVKAARL